MKKIKVLALACLMVMGVSSPAQSEGFALYEWGARSVALGGATMARKPDASVLSSNPAAMTRLEGTHVQAGITGVKPHGKMDFADGPPSGRGAGTSDKVKNKVWTIPSAYFTHQLSERAFIGIGEFSRFGLGFEYPDDWAGRYNIYQVSVVTASINPNFAYKVTDKLSLAVGAEFMYVDISLRKKVQAGPVDIDFNTETENVEHAFNFALHYQFNEQWAAGAAYRTRLKHNVEGKLHTDRDIPGAIYNQDFTATVYMPDSASFGLSYSPTPKLSIEAGAIWTHWSQFTDLDFQFEGAYLGKRQNKKYWHNTWRLNIGVEYALTDWVDLRAGYVWDECPVPEDREDYLIPTDNRNIWSLGAGFKLSNWTIDTAYAYVDPRERHYKSRPQDGVYESKTRDSGSHILSLSVGYKF